MSIIDKIAPDESHLPPSRRTWARLIRLPGGWEALELRDPNSGQGADPDTKPRHQYLVHPRAGVDGLTAADQRLWTRRLPPAPIEQPEDESRWADEPQGIIDPRTESAWQLVEPGRGLPWEWAVEQGVRPYATRPIQVDGEWDLHGDGECATVGYVMPPRDPWDTWAAVTGARCPLCDQTLVWYEAGYVPGYRVCMAQLDADHYDRDSIRHRWLWLDGVLVLEE